MAENQAPPPLYHRTCDSSSSSSTTTPTPTAITTTPSLSKLSSTCTVCLAGPEKMSISIIECFNNRDYLNPVVSHMTPTCHSEHEYIEARSLHEFIETHRSIIAVYPDYHVEVIDSVGEVDMVNGRAKIWLSLEVRGYPKNVRREGISLLYWRISRGEWSHYRNVGMVLGGGGDSDWSALVRSLREEEGVEEEGEG